MDDCCPDGVSVLMHRVRDITDNVGLVSKYFKHPRRERLGTVGQGLELFDSTNRLPTGFGSLCSPSIIIDLTVNLNWGVPLSRKTASSKRYLHENVEGCPL